MYFALYCYLGAFVCSQYVFTCPEYCNCDRYHKVTCNSVPLSEEALKTLKLPSKTVSVRLSNNGIKRISSDILRALENITSLEISKNNIMTIPDFTFIRFKHLRKLRLKHNKIHVIYAESFNGLQHLEYLSLEGNQISLLGEGMFKTLRSIRSLMLSNNKLQTIPNDVFIKLKSLKNLYLSDNNISSIGDKAFQNLTMSKLGISFNRIKRLPVTTFIGFDVRFKILLLYNPLECECIDLMIYSYYYKHLKNKILGHCSSPSNLKNKNILTAYRETTCSLCDLNLCQNDGVCIGNHSSIQCECTKKYSGKYCETDVCRQVIENIKYEKEMKKIYVNKTKEVVIYIKDKVEGRTIAILYLTCSIEFLIIFCLVIILVWRKCDDWKMEKRYSTETYTKKYKDYFAEDKNNIYVTKRASTHF